MADRGLKAEGVSKMLGNIQAKTSGERSTLNYSQAFSKYLLKVRICQKKRAVFRGGSCRPHAYFW